MNAGKSFEFERHTGYARLALFRELNAFHWADIERSATDILASLDQAQSPAVIVDLSPLDYLGSAQLTLLIRVWKSIKSSGGRMVVEATTPVVREVLNTAGLGSLWEFAESREASFERLGLQPDGRAPVSILWSIIGLISLTGALAGLAVSLTQRNSFDSRASLAVQLTCSAVALICGLWTVARGSGMRRGLGLSMVLASALLAAVEVFNYSR